MLSPAIQFRKYVIGPEAQILKCYSSAAGCNWLSLVHIKDAACLWEKSLRILRLFTLRGCGLSHLWKVKNVVKSLVVSWKGWPWIAWWDSQFRASVTKHSMRQNPDTEDSQHDSCSNLQTKHSKSHETTKIHWWASTMILLKITPVMCLSQDHRLYK